MIAIYRILFFIMIKISEDVTPWIRGCIARRRLQKKKISSRRPVASIDLVNRTPSLRAFVVEPNSSASSQ